MAGHRALDQRVELVQCVELLHGLDRTVEILAGILVGDGAQFFLIERQRVAPQAALVELVAFLAEGWGILGHEVEGK